MKKRPSFEPTREFHTLDKVWDDSRRNSLSMGCTGCPWLNECGGMHVEAGLFSCADLCTCSDKTACDNICSSNPKAFVRAYRAVNGFSLENVKRVPRLLAPNLPHCVPFVSNGYSRAGRLEVPVAVLSLYDLVHMKNGTLHVSTPSELAERFKLSPSTQIILSGIERDFLLEPWWGFSKRPDILVGLKLLDISLITSPNFSVLANVPRPDHLYNMKRIANTWTEIVEAGIPCALHVNASTEAEYRNWTNFVLKRNEVTALSFEFGTGAGYDKRIDWHVAQLCDLANSVNRPLTLIIRGGKRKLFLLQQAFHKVVFIDTDSFARTIKRQKAFIAEGGKLKWAKEVTKQGEPLDALLAANIDLVKGSIPQVTAYTETPIMRRLSQRLAYDADYQTGQPGFVGDPHLPRQAGTISRKT